MKRIREIKKSLLSILIESYFANAFVVRLEGNISRKNDGEKLRLSVCLSRHETYWCVHMKTMGIEMTMTTMK